MIFDISPERNESQKFKNKKRNPVYPYLLEGHEKYMIDCKSLDAADEIERLYAIVVKSELKDVTTYHIHTPIQEFRNNPVTKKYIAKAEQEGLVWAISGSDGNVNFVLSRRNDAKKVSYGKFLGYRSKAEIKRK
ncbi:hypothetical protein ABNM11_24970 [Pseudomonas syringae]|uniref:Uncharacterized protein n=1 Tax=Pseudomonas amygdali pv. eriobotryae TaxID=129137 RepID=A0A9P3AH31_PSEA0|nr:hypothetical protein [Pseudomonas amygdali]GFZ62115.1 hypothetical protein PSE10A_46260 [Pseudomonas amygdali pv. eriobotryae]